MKNDDYNWANRINRLEAENAELKAKLSAVNAPDFIYDQGRWDVTHDFKDYDYLLDDVPAYEVVQFQTLRHGPDVFLVAGSWLSDSKWFYTKEEANAYADHLRAKGDAE